MKEEKDRSDHRHSQSQSICILACYSDRGNWCTSFRLEEFYITSNAHPSWKSSVYRIVFRAHCGA